MGRGRGLVVGSPRGRGSQRAGFYTQAVGGGNNTAYVINQPHLMLGFWCMSIGPVMLWMPTCFLLPDSAWRTLHRHRRLRVNRMCQKIKSEMLKRSRITPHSEVGRFEGVTPQMSNTFMFTGEHFSVPAAQTGGLCVLLFCGNRNV